MTRCQRTNSRVVFWSMKRTLMQKQIQSEGYTTQADHQHR